MQPGEYDGSLYAKAAMWFLATITAASRYNYRHCLKGCIIPYYNTLKVNFVQKTKYHHTIYKLNRCFSIIKNYTPKPQFLGRE